MSTPAPQQAARSRAFSGAQPTSSSFHLGNYLGALQQWVALQDQELDTIYSVVDLHAITLNPPEPEQLRARTRSAAAQMLAAGVDPSRSILFVQSHVAAHARLSWVIECLTGYGEATRMTQFKDKSTRGQTHSVGLLTYPMLMAADILLYDAALVPVGEDQRQHIELTRDVATRFNSRYGETFVIPEGFIPAASAKIYDLQDPTAKMSKSLGEAGTLELLDDPAVLTRKIKRAVTDADADIRFDPVEKPGVSNLLTILAAVTGREVPAVAAELAGQGYGTLKTHVADAVVAFSEPFAARTKELLDDPAELDRILAAGAEAAAVIADAKLAEVYERVGFLPINAGTQSNASAQLQAGAQSHAGSRSTSGS